MVESVMVSLTFLNERVRSCSNLVAVVAVVALPFKLALIVAGNFKLKFALPLIPVTVARLLLSLS